MQLSADHIWCFERDLLSDININLQLCSPIFVSKYWRWQHHAKFPSS